MKVDKNPENFYKVHIFCCLNIKEGDNLLKSCGGKGAVDLFEFFKLKLKEYNLPGIRINKAGCLGKCRLGKVMVIYPQAVWYHYDNQEDIIEIIESHLLNQSLVERLILDPSKN